MINPAIGAHKAKQGLLVAKSYYFMFFAALACLAPFFNVYLTEIGLSGAEIGWLGSIAPLVALAANPIWGAIADRWQIHRQVLALCALVSGVFTLLFLPVHDFWIFVVLVTALTFFRIPISAIVDSTVIDMVKQVKVNYGSQRLWGTFGFVIVSFGLGQVLTPAHYAIVFWLHAALLGVGCVILSFLLPVRGIEQRVSLRQGISILLGQRNYVSFLIAMILSGMGMAGYVNFLGLQIIALNGTDQQIGLAWACGAILEVPAMYFGPRWFAHYSSRQVILGGFLGIALVYIGVGLSPTPIQVIITVLAMGICFGSFLQAAVNYASEAAPPGVSATAQALMGAAQSGLGWSLGSVATGYLWDTLGGHTVFFFAGGMVILATLIFWLGSRES